MHLFQNARNMNHGRKKQGLYKVQHFVEHLCIGMSSTRDRHISLCSQPAGMMLKLG